MLDRISHRLRLAAAIGGLFLTTEVDARSSAVRVGEITGGDERTVAALRALVTDEIGRLEPKREQRSDQYVFSAALVKLDASRSRSGARASSVVSGTLRRARTGAIVAFTRGSGSAEDERGTEETVKAEALGAAVHGAVRHVSEAL